MTRPPSNEPAINPSQKYDCCSLRHAICDVKLKVLTKMPAANAPNAPTMESYEKVSKVALRL